MQQDLTQETLATKLQLAGLSIDRSALAKIECGMRPVYDFELIVIASVLKVSVTDLFPSEKQFKKQLPHLIEGHI